MSEGFFYLKLGGRVEGPYTIGQIYDLWAARKISSQTPFSRVEERDKWQPLAELTLTISPPRPVAPKAQVAEPTPGIPSRPRSAPALRPEEYIPTIPQKVEAQSRPPKRTPGFSSVWFRKMTLRLEFGIGLCFVTGVVLALYFMIFFTASPTGNEINQERLFMKLTGVITGIGLVLTGGLLTVARQLKQYLAGQKQEAPGKSDRKPTPS